MARPPFDRLPTGLFTVQYRHNDYHRALPFEAHKSPQTRIIGGDHRGTRVAGEYLIRLLRRLGLTFLHN